MMEIGCVWTCLAIFQRWTRVWLVIRLLAVLVVGCVGDVLQNMVSKDDHKLANGEVVGGKWKVAEKLGEGGFGAVYKVININATTKEDYAMKVESVKADEPMVKMEAAVLKTFRNLKMSSPHICQYIESGGTGKIWFVVMQLVGQNVADLRRVCPDSRFSESTATRLGIQAITAVESLHRIGFIHRDIKPANFAMGLHGAQLRTVYLLDFGLARQYLTPEGQMRPARLVAGFRGTLRYASINAHLRKDLGRHDDIWSMFYMMVEFHQGDLPWRLEKEKNAVLRLKRDTPVEKLCAGMEKEYQLMYKDLSHLRFDDTPNYASYQMQLIAIAARKHYKDSDPFDWEDGGRGYESVKKAPVPSNPYHKKEKADKKREREKIENAEPSE